MATLRNKRKLAAVSRETPEGSRSSRGQNVFDPELTRNYISQVSEEMEGRATKKLSKEFSKTESRILGALSKLDEFLLNPQARTCSVAAQETLMRKTGKPPRIAPQATPITKWDVFPITLANSMAQRQKSTLTRSQQLKRRFPTAPLLLRQANRRRRAPQVNHNFAVRISMPQLKQTRFFGPSTIGDEL